MPVERNGESRIARSRIGYRQYPQAQDTAQNRRCGRLLARADNLP
mgnify:CR=1 FL=1